MAVAVRLGRIVQPVLSVGAAAGAAAATALVVWVTYRKWKWWLSPLSRIPSPPETSAILGHRIGLAKAGETHLKWALQYGDIVSQSLFLVGGCVTITSSEDIRRVLVVNVSSYRKPGVLHLLLGALARESLFLAEGDTHKRQRKIISDAFHFENISKLSINFANQTNNLVSTWLKQVNSAAADGSVAVEVDMLKTMCNLTLDMIGLTGFGHEFHACSEQQSALGAAYSDALSCTAVTLTNMINHLWPFKFLPLAGVLKERDALRRIHSAVADIIKNRRAAMSAARDEAERDRLAGDLLGLMLRAVDKGVNSGAAGLSDAELRDNVINFILAGHQTTASHLSWTLYLLAKHPAAAERVRAEVRRATGGGERLPAAADLESMPFLGSVMREALRLHPSTTVALRVAEKAGVKPV